MTDYWEARRRYIEVYCGCYVTYDPWGDRVRAAETWHRAHSQLAGEMNLSMIPPGKKFVMERGLPVGADVLKLGPVRP